MVQSAAYLWHRTPWRVAPGARLRCGWPTCDLPVGLQPRSGNVPESEKGSNCREDMSRMSRKARIKAEAVGPCCAVLCALHAAHRHPHVRHLCICVLPNKLLTSQSHKHVQSRFHICNSSNSATMLSKQGAAVAVAGCSHPTILASQRAMLSTSPRHQARLLVPLICAFHIINNLCATLLLWRDNAIDDIVSLGICWLHVQRPLHVLHGGMRAQHRAASSREAPGREPGSQRKLANCAHLTTCHPGNDRDSGPTPLDSSTAQLLPGLASLRCARWYATGCSACFASAPTPRAT